MRLPKQHHAAHSSGCGVLDPFNRGPCLWSSGYLIVTYISIELNFFVFPNTVVISSVVLLPTAGHVSGMCIFWNPQKL